MSDVESHRAAFDAALASLGVGWSAWPDVLTDRRLSPDARLSGVLVLLATVEHDAARPGDMLCFDPFDERLDWMGRHRQPWDRLSSLSHPWTAATATTAVTAVTGRAPYDDRRVAIALRGARQVCAAGLADAALLDALTRCADYFAAIGDEQHRVTELLRLARRVIATVAPPGILDLSLLEDGDTWAGPARDAARALPADEVSPLVRLLVDLGPRKPGRRWLAEVDRALRPSPARDLLRRWVELAAVADPVPEWPGSWIGACCATLFVGANGDIVRAAAFATTCLPGESWPAELLGSIARRGAVHNGLDGFPQALAFGAASAAVDALITRGGEADRGVMVRLIDELPRRDLRKRIRAALAEA
ncbi:hypothetical protein [Nocardioides sp. SYSU DS0651]|uniref:hypothetical protein n=1 Tax=Nocardioides sp. SYSU DS0651 TaxID=3415955 RepID=UPI003F4C1823